MFFNTRKATLPDASNAIAGREEEMAVTNRHFVNGNPIQPPFPEGIALAVFGMGCFWGAERILWQQAGVYATAVGYAGGITQNPGYREVCSGLTGHTEAVLVAFDPTVVSYDQLLSLFWEGHDPTQGMRQGNDLGTQYRSAVYTHGESQYELALQSKNRYEQKLEEAGMGKITTEIKPAPVFYYAEDDHQQYLAKNPGGYCGLGGTGIRCGS